MKRENRQTYLPADVAGEVPGEVASCCPRRCSCLKIMNEEYAVLIPKKSRRELFQRIFTLGIFGGRGWVSLYAATLLIVVLSPGHSYITSFRPWSPITTENHLDRA